MSVYQNPKTGKWEARAHYRHPVTGYPVTRKRSGFDSENQAKLASKKLLFALMEELAAKKAPLWPDAVEATIKAKLNDGTWQTPTADNAKVVLAAVTYPAWVGRTVETVTTEEIRLLIKTQIGDKSKSYQQSVLKFIKAVFEHCVESGYIPRNPTPRIKHERVDKVDNVLNLAQAKKLVSDAFHQEIFWAPHWALALYTGMRNGELYALTWNDVDLENRRIRVTKSYNKKVGIKSTKTKHHRLVEINSELIPILSRLKESSLDNSDPVLPRSRDWDKGEQARELRHFLSAIGLPQVRFHDLRATWATIMLQTPGVSIASVMAMGGWKKMETMQRYIRKAGIAIEGITAQFSLADGGSANE